MSKYKVVRINPDRTESVYSSPHVVERTAFSKCRSLSAWYARAYPDLQYLFVVRPWTGEDIETKVPERPEPRLWSVYDEIGNLKAYKITIQKARSLIEDNDWTMA